MGAPGSRTIPEGYRGMQGNPDQGMQQRGRDPPSRPRSPGMHGRSSGQGAGGYGGMQGQGPSMQQGGTPWHMQGGMQRGMQGAPHVRPDQLTRSAPHGPQDGGYRGRLQGI